MPYNEEEQEAITDIFAEMLRACTKDGGEKRKAGKKVDWRIDQDHRRGFYSHLYKYEKGDRKDEDSGAHPLVHAAWRLLAIAYQETYEEECWKVRDEVFLERINSTLYYDGTNDVFPNPNPKGEGS